jgi:hypothetical protein
MFNPLLNGVNVDTASRAPLRYNRDFQHNNVKINRDYPTKIVLVKNIRIYPRQHLLRIGLFFMGVLSMANDVAHQLEP